jgi:hypothetical protein
MYRIAMALNNVVQYILIPVFTILIVHFLIDIRLDVSLAYFRIVTICVALIIGFRLAWPKNVHLITSLSVGLTVAILADIGMSINVWIARGGGAVLPVSATEWQDVIEFSISIVLGTIAGTLFASVFYRVGSSADLSKLSSNLRKLLFETRDQSGITSRLRFAEKLLKALTAVILAAGALYAGIRGVFR